MKKADSMETTMYGRYVLGVLLMVYGKLCPVVLVDCTVDDNMKGTS